MTRPSDESDSPPEPAPGAAEQSEMQSEADTLAGWYRMAGVGIEFVVAVALFAGIGYAIDRWRGSSPWGLLIGAGLGFAVGLRTMIRVARREFKQ